MPGGNSLVQHTPMLRHRRRKSMLGALAPKFALLCVGVMVAAYAMQAYYGDAAEDGAVVPARRKLYEYEAGVCDSFLVSHYKTLAMALLIWGIFYMFWGLAIVCDDYFVTSLEDISEALHLSSDVAGATFMAAGSSAPELFTSLMGVFAVKNDVGIGTIVGSAVFNLCCIIGGTALFTPFTLEIDWKPITRDTLFYGVSIAAMIYVLQDGLVTLSESVGLIACYVVYVIFMFFNPKIMDCAVARPLNLIFEVTIPNCSLPHNKHKYLATFFTSILWIGVLSYFMVTWASKLGCIWNIHPAIMGVTVLAAGTSVPDAIGSLLVARDGQGDMAVSNAIGSNVFDILLGLGLPWMLACLIWPDQPGVTVDAEALMPLSIILIATLFAVYGVALASGFRLTKCVGLIFFSFYFIFVAYDLLHEFDKIPF